MSSLDNLPTLLTTLGSAVLVLAVIAGGIVVARMPRTVRLPRALAATGLFLILGHAVWTILEMLVIYPHLFDSVPPLVLNILGWLSFLAMTVGFALLVVAATMAPKPARPATHSPYPPHTQPQSPPAHAGNE